MKWDGLSGLSAYGASLGNDHGKVKVLARAGVVAENVTATGRSNQELRGKIRGMVERATVRLEQVQQKEFMSLEDIEMLQRLLKLIRELEVADSDPSKMSDEELAKAAK